MYVISASLMELPALKIDSVWNCLESSLSWHIPAYSNILFFYMTMS